MDRPKPTAKLAHLIVVDQPGQEHGLPIFLRPGHSLHCKDMFLSILEHQRGDQPSRRQLRRPTQPESFAVNPRRVAEPVDCDT